MMPRDANLSDSYKSYTLIVVAFSVWGFDKLFFCLSVDAFQPIVTSEIAKRYAAIVIKRAPKILLASKVAKFTE